MLLWTLQIPTYFIQYCYVTLKFIYANWKLPLEELVALHEFYLGTFSQIINILIPESPVP